MDVKNGLVRGFLKVIGAIWAQRIDTPEIVAEVIGGREMDTVKGNISNLQNTTAQLNSQLGVWQLDNITFSRNDNEVFRIAFRYAKTLQIWFDICVFEQKLRVWYYDGKTAMVLFENTRSSNTANTFLFSAKEQDLNTVSNGIYVLLVPEVKFGHGLPATWYQLISTTDGNSTGIQTAFNLFNGNHYHRNLAAGTWSNFVYI